MVVIDVFLMSKNEVNHERAAQALAPREHEIRKTRKVS
jgi:hypothetical protein